MKKLNVALVGLGFGLEFVAIYCKHPDIDKVYVVDKNEKLLNIAKERYSIPDERCFTDLQDVLDIPEIDAVHLVTPPATHAPFSVRVLNAGKHCGCTIPMGMSIQELNDIIAARKASGKNYMFMETTVFGREYFYVKDLLDQGKFAVIPVDMCGAIAMKRSFPTHIIYVARDKEKLIADIIDSDYDTEEKTLRILSIDAEKRNRKICDYVIHNDTIEGERVSGEEEIRRLILLEGEKY